MLEGLFGEILNFLHQVEPVVLVIIGVIMFIFAGMARWLVRLVGGGIAVYGLLVLLGYL
ncbi:hypothetical protein ES703_04376 [subsurface metagenome]